jgi:hypothetical protein
LRDPLITNLLLTARVMCDNRLVGTQSTLRQEIEA